jgi:hypothetical protein
MNAPLPSLLLSLQQLSGKLDSMKASAPSDGIAGQQIGGLSQLARREPCPAKSVAAAGNGRSLDPLHMHLPQLKIV